MPGPTGWSSWDYSAPSNDANIDALIGGTQWSSAVVSYSFPPGASSWSTSSSGGYGSSTGSGEPWNGFAELSSSDRAAVREILSCWAAVANIRFTEVADTGTGVGDLRFAYSSAVDEGAQAHAYRPGGSASAGDVWFNSDGTSFSETWTRGSYPYQTAIHEIGHALGLKHPFEGSTQNSTVSDAGWDTRSFTIMSYSAKAGNDDTHFSFEPTTPMVLDILAIQHLYGANMRWHAGNDTYTFSSGRSYHQTIWDAGGIDTIRYDAAAGGGVIDLRPGHGSEMGHAVSILDSFGSALGTVKNVWIAFGAIIENATGGSGNDRLTGNGAANTLNGGAGADILLGGAGNDIYVVDRAGDKVYETTTTSSTTDAGGIDLIRSSVSFSLAASTGVSFVERLTLTGSAPINGSGNALHNVLTGNAAANSLSGGNGNDTLIGGAGNDRLAGGAGGDVFHFNSLLGSDTITDFNSAADTFRFSQAGIRIGDGDAAVDGFAVRSGSGGFSAATEVVLFTPNVASLTPAGAAAVIGSAKSGFAAGATRLFVVDDGADSGIFLFTSSAANAQVSAPELTLLATFDAAQSAASDYVFVA